MHKLCILIVLIFVFKLGLTDVDEDGFTCNCSNPNEKSTEKIIAFGDRVSHLVDLPASDLKILYHIDSLEYFIKDLTKKNDPMISTMMAALNGIDALNKHVVRYSMNFPQNCGEATNHTHSSGIYDIKIEKYSIDPFQVYCEEDLFDGGWTVIARRTDGSVDFDRNWMEYKSGFGNIEGEFFIGMDKLHALTNGKQMQELIFVLGDFDDNRRYAKYSTFVIGDESEEYLIKTLGYYSGDAGDSFTSHRNRTFKTKDRDSTKDCTKYGPWWHYYCYESNLFGTYLKGPYESDIADGVVWMDWLGDYYSLKFVQMMIRPKRT